MVILFSDKKEEEEYCTKIFPYFHFYSHFGEILHKKKDCQVDDQFWEEQLKLMRWLDLKSQHSVIVVHVS
jgi:hypothetical protein